jgi:hypothetical protein
LKAIQEKLKKGRSKMRILACTLFALAVSVPPGNPHQAQQPIKENIPVKVLKIERTQNDQNGTLWYTLKWVLRDSNSKLYHVWTSCVSSNPNSDVSCGNIPALRVGQTYEVLNYGDTHIKFPEAKIFYEISSIEISDCR